ncbi:hypothetical protein ASG11_06930 [Sphingomonas sp. Leaf357]|uniref:PEPxxWA-CTERM sorting domain-containing protein n=1 Tax=Sphingomonas sp. Leaf357 TaxID=1736350 RepID=UPI000700D14B|nr:PEPxxWA-CTERM sorting domain-containing protein [Sphingomonas sp. Leaf357]KQS04017.1 hypothetical protein ASG11_06930 [Sphingomonas sp. Leaf357]
MKTMMKTLLAGAAIVGSMAMIAMPASASVIDFSDVTSGSCAYAGASLTSGGFTFSAPGNAVFVCNSGVLAQNTSAAIVAANGLSVLNFAPVAGGVFSLNGFQAGSRTADFNITTGSTQSATGILVEGLSGSIVVASTSFSFTGFDFSTFQLSNAFSGLTSARITATGPNANAEFVLDNVVVNAAAVPEPATWGMMILGFGMIGAAARSRKVKTSVAFA